MHLIRALLYSLTFFAILFISGSWLLIPEIGNNKTFNTNYIFITGLIELITVILFITLIKKFDQTNLKIGNKMLIMLSVFLGLIYPFIQTPLNWIYNILFNTEHFITYDFGGTSHTIPNIIAAIIIIPLAEELFFKLVIQETLQKNILVNKAILLTAILFAFVHLPLDALFIKPNAIEFHTAYIALLIGLLSGWLYAISRNIWPSLLMHMSTNLMVTLI